MTKAIGGGWSKQSFSSIGGIFSEAYIHIDILSTRGVNGYRTLVVGVVVLQTVAQICMASTGGSLASRSAKSIYLVTHFAFVFSSTCFQLEPARACFNVSTLSTRFAVSKTLTSWLRAMSVHSAAGCTSLLRLKVENHCGCSWNANSNDATNSQARQKSRVNVFSFDLRWLSRSWLHSTPAGGKGKKNKTTRGIGYFVIIPN